MLTIFGVIFSQFENMAGWLLVILINERALSLLRFNSFIYSASCANIIKTSLIVIDKL